MWKVFTKTDLELLIFFRCNGKEGNCMNTDIIAELHESDNKMAYALLQQLEMISEESSEL